MLWKNISTTSWGCSMRSHVNKLMTIQWQTGFSTFQIIPISVKLKMFSVSLEKNRQRRSAFNYSRKLLNSQPKGLSGTTNDSWDYSREGDDSKLIMAPQQHNTRRHNTQYTTKANCFLITEEEISDEGDLWETIKKEPRVDEHN